MRGSTNEVYLIDTPNNLLERRPFRISIILLLQ